MHRFLAIALMLNGCSHLLLVERGKTPLHDRVWVRLEAAGNSVMEAASVKAVLPNGDFSLEGPTVSGVVRPIDIAIDGTVRSAYVTAR